MLQQILSGCDTVWISYFWVKGGGTQLDLRRKFIDVVACLQALTGSKTRSVQSFRAAERDNKQSDGAEF